MIDYFTQRQNAWYMIEHDPEPISLVEREGSYLEEEEEEYTL